MIDSVSESNNPQKSQLQQKQSYQNQQKGRGQSSDHIEGEDDKINYYNQFCRLFLINTILTTQLNQLVIQKAQLGAKLARLERRVDQLTQGGNGQIDQKKRRIRRSAHQIARHYKCHVEGCNKSYGSQGSLNQHIKIKHPYVYRGMTFQMNQNPTVKQSMGQDDQDQIDESID